jgi:CotH protein.
MNTHFAASRALALIDRNAAELAPEIQRHHLRWNTGSLSQWSAAVQVLRDFYTARPASQRQHIVSNFQLNGTISVQLNAEPTGAGTIQISTVMPKSLPWTGIYFNGNPVTLTAIPNPGYTFSHWAPNPNISNTGQPSFTADFSTSASLTAHFSGSPENTDLIISEINYNSDSTRNAGDWVEIRNNSGSPIDISGYWLRDNDWFHRFDIPTGTVLAPGGHLVVYESKGKFTGEHPGVANAIGSLDFKLDNIADEVYLYDRDSNVAAWASYSSKNPWPCSAAGFGSTLERRDPNSDPSAPESWFAGCVGGSPGATYSPCAYLPALTELNYKSSPGADAGDWIELFNHADFSIDLSNWKIGDGNGNLFTIPNGTLLQPGEHHVFYQDDAKFSARFPQVSKKTGPLGFGLDGNGDHVRLFSATGQLRFDLCYNDAAPWPTQPDGQGYTLEIKDINGIWNDADNWFAGCPEGSPGQAFDINCGNVSTQDPRGETLRFAVSPNPTSGMATLTPSQPLMPQQVRWSLADQSGRVLATQTGTSLDLSTLPNGVYWVWVNGQVLRLVKG